MEFKYQVVGHASYYPSSALFETYEEAKAFYDSVKGSSYDRGCVTLCKIEEVKGDLDSASNVIDWGLDFYEQE